ncbi:hypothetical protein SAMN03080601_03524 [Alkalitalea saponilacus]|uniref:Uncharacterized protein n=1 Tax=Alkalitalea saponilacus TaxID=889453 RepID=A0A1T5HU69_9BACT|nr:hypothetical protein SAMN03080601_03524 [Alkalitalea saponilacus]
MQYSKRRVLWFLEPFCPASSHLTVDNDAARIPPHAILLNVVCHNKWVTTK